MAHRAPTRPSFDEFEQVHAECFGRMCPVAGACAAARGRGCSCLRSILKPSGRHFSL
jgi:hypothetical protein